MLQYFLLFCALLCFLVYKYFKFKYSFFKKLNLPYIEPSIPFGNLSRNVLGKISTSEMAAEIYREYKHLPLIGMFQFHSPILLINNPDYVRDILVRLFPNFQDRGFHVNEEIDPLLGHLFLLRGEKWQNLRNKLSPSFTSGKIKGMFDVLIKHTEKLVEFLDAKDEKIVEVKEVFSRLLTDIIASCAFGIESNCIENPNSEFREWGRKSNTPTIRMILVPILMKLCKPLREILRIPFVDKELTKYFIEMVRSTIEHREKNNILRNDFMQILIELKNNPDKSESLSESQLAAQAFVFFQAGFETSSLTMSYAIYELAKNPEIQERVQKEIDEKTKGQGFTYETLRQMVYLEKIINETLRKYPPLTILNRHVTKSLEMPWGENGQMINLEKGFKIMIPTLGLHRDPKYYPDPEKFDPERFDEEEKVKRHRYVYLPFGEGPRFCIGSRFGMIQTKVGLAILLHNYTFKFCEKTPIPLEFSKRAFLLVPKDDLYFNYENRI